MPTNTFISEIERQQVKQWPSYFGLPESGFTYAQAKAAVVKMYYSYDDRIALMLNYQENPEDYTTAYQEMQSWREVAGQVAKKLVGEE
jgi:hypothetical protein